MIPILLLFALVAYPTAAEEQAQNQAAVERLQKSSPSLKIVAAKRTAEAHDTGKPIWECENKTPVQSKNGAHYCEVK